VELLIVLADTTGFRLLQTGLYEFYNSATKYVSTNDFEIENPKNFLSIGRGEEYPSSHVIL